MKTIHATIFEPHKSSFKNFKNARAECVHITCSNSENCDLYKDGRCSFLRFLNWQKCPYGKYYKDIGYTNRAKNYFKWLNAQKEKYKDVPILSSHRDIMAIVGNYILLPYSHVTMNETIPFLGRGGALHKENCFLEKKFFTIDNIISICEFIPMSLFGGEIDTYQKEVVPIFIKHLSEIFPKLYNALIKTYPRAKKIVDGYNYVGRKAILQTLNPNIGKFIDIHKGEWEWDGEYLTSYNSRASFMIVSKFSEIRIKPEKNVEVKITDNLQVNKNTIFGN